MQTSACRCSLRGLLSKLDGTRERSRAFRDRKAAYGLLAAQSGIARFFVTNACTTEVMRQERIAVTSRGRALDAFSHEPRQPALFVHGQLSEQPFPQLV